ncbi:MAG: hypothetical protein NXI24_03585 [bacterium]|nr:hypothetical protein [bacterium]
MPTPGSHQPGSDRAAGTGQSKEARAFAIIVYHALRSDLARLDEDDALDETRARAMILRAVNLFPGYEARKDPEFGHLILIDKTDEGQNTVSLNIQDAVDSLLIVWRDFQKLRSRDGG